MNIIKKYTKPDVDLITELFGRLWNILANMPDDGFDDILGQIYMLSDTGNKKAGQFFTPYNVSKLCAEMSLSGRKDLSNEIITIYEPACGSGGMILAVMDVLKNTYKVNYTEHAFVVAGDVDSRCVHMCYIQLSLAGIPAIVEQRNALTMELIGETWKTPAYIFQYIRFRDVLKGTVHSANSKG